MSTSWPIGALAHAGDAIEDVFTAADGGHGGEEAGGGAGIAAVKIGGGVGDFSIAAVDEDLGGGFVDFEFEAESLEAVEHDVGVVSEEEVCQAAWAGGEGGDDQGAVGEAFRAGRSEFGGEGFVHRLQRHVAHRQNLM